MNGRTLTGTADTSSVLGKVVLVVGSLAGAGGHLTLTDIAECTGLPRSSVHRILDQLVRHGWLDRDANRYRLGLRMIELGSLATRHNQLHQVAAPELWRLNQRTGHVVHLALLDRTEIVYLYKCNGRFGLRVPSEVGLRQPAHCTALGKALLAHLGSDVTEAVVGAGLERRTPATIARPGRLRAELEHVRERGVAMDRGEALPHVSCVGVPVLGDGRAVAAISLCGPIRHWDPAAFAPVVRETAVRIRRAFQERWAEATL